jgi:uncharacterized protein YqhQ
MSGSAGLKTADDKASVAASIEVSGQVEVAPAPAVGVVKVGGQALADGVLMRTSRAWAIARADGTVEVGALPPTPAARIPVLRVVAGLFGALKLAVSRGMLGRGSQASPEAKASVRRMNRRFLTVLVVLEAGAYLLSRAFGDFTVTGRGLVGILYTVVPWAATLLALRLFTPQTLWRYHGAEHKAVSAHEQGVDLADTAAVLRAERVHNRCGTNLVFLMLAVGLALRGHVGGWAQVPVFVGLLGLSAEVIGWLAARPRWAVTRLVLSGGKALQRWVTTAEPTAAEQAVGCRALLACLDEHARVVAAALPV